MERPEAQDAGTIILTGFEPEIVSGSVRTTIEEHQQISKGTQKIQIQRTTTDNNSENLPAGRAGLSNLRHLRSIPKDYTITDTSWRVLKLILGNTKLSNKWWSINK